MAATTKLAGAPVELFSGIGASCVLRTDALNARNWRGLHTVGIEDARTQIHCGMLHEYAGVSSLKHVICCVRAPPAIIKCFRTFSISIALTKGHVSDLDRTVEAYRD